MSQANRRTVKRVVMTIAGVVAWGFLAFALFPDFASTHAADRMTRTLGQLKSTTLALLVYANDHDDRLPPGLNWSRTLGLSDDSLRNNPESRLWRALGQAQESPYCCALNRSVTSATLSDMDPNDILVTEYSAQMSDQLTDAVPEFPMYSSIGVGCTDGIALLANKQKVLEALVTNSPLNSSGFWPSCGSAPAPIRSRLRSVTAPPSVTNAILQR